MKTKVLFTILFSAILLFSVDSFSQKKEKNIFASPTNSTAKKIFYEKGYSPYADKDFPVRVYWGDQHVHTGWSADAGASGTRTTPEDAVRFAMGEELILWTGQKARLDRALDWVVIADHSDGAGVIASIISGDPELMKDPILKQWNADMNNGKQGDVMSDMIGRQSKGTLPDALTDPEFLDNIWKQNTTIMEKYNDPGHFTALIGYEWTSNYGGGNNLHRNVIYRDNKAKADMVTPMTTFTSENPEDLWKWMEAWEKKTGGSLLAIPHNGNLSNGLMFALTTFDGKPLTKEWAAARQKWEVLYEVTQGKGTSEAHPSMSPNDEFADFELWDKGNLNLVPKKPGDLKTEYARDALKNGLYYEKKLGVNPFKFGLVGGTDTHTGLSAINEDDYWGKYGTTLPSPERWNADELSFEGRVIKGWQLGSSGWTGVWAKENTRESIWDAMKRKETYATTGPRISVRFFGGFDFIESDGNTRQPALAGYKKGVPMGGDLYKAPKGKKISFLVAALKDPHSGNLDRVQIIKGWLGKDGKTHEKVYTVAWGDADKRKMDANGKVPPVGNTVDKNTATYKNTIGDPDLVTVWEDPDFDPNVAAFYYARVIEIPTPRWTTYDAVKFNLKLTDDVPVWLQERCYTSPIWYNPKAK